jgi:hypothetical protein
MPVVYQNNMLTRIEPLKKRKDKTKHNQSCVIIGNTKLHAWSIDITQKMTKCLLLKHKFFPHIPLWFYKFHDVPHMV